MQFFFQSVHEHVRACHDPIVSRRGPHHPCPLLGNEGNFMVQGSLSRKEQSAFPLISEEGSVVVALRKEIWSAPLSHFSFHAPLPREKSGVGSRWQYMAFVLAVQSPCTRSTTFMYSQYKAHVLPPRETLAAIYTPSSCNLNTLQPQSTHPLAASYTPSSCNLHTLQPQSTYLPAAIYTPSNCMLHTLQPQTAQTTFANSTPSCRRCDNFSNMVIVSVKRS